MFFYQILIAAFPEFCFINLFFFGLLYAVFYNNRIWTLPSFILRFNSLNLSLFFYIILLLIYIIYVTSFNSLDLSFFFNFVHITPVTTSLEIFILSFSLILFLSIYSFLKNIKERNTEFLLLFSILISCFLIVSKLMNLFTIVFILEIILVLFYALIMYVDNFKTTTLLEGFTKFFLTASISSSFLLLGILFLYKAIGSCNLTDLNLILLETYSNSVNDSIWELDNLFFTDFKFIFLLIPSLLFFSAGLFFKFAVVPFHSWSPDLYQVMPTSILVIISTLPKFIYGIIMLKFFVFSLHEFSEIWNWILIFISSLSFFYSVFLLLEVDNIKRFLAYSSIPHLTTVFLIILSNNIFYLSISLIYLFIYILALQSILLLFTLYNSMPHFFSNLKRLFLHNAIYSWFFVLLLLQLAGLPPFSIFLLKLNVLNFLLSSGYFFLYLIMVVSSFYSIYYYMRIIKIIFFDKVALFSLSKNLDMYYINFDNFKAVSFIFLIFLQLLYVIYPTLFFNISFYFCIFFN